MVPAIRSFWQPRDITTKFKKKSHVVSMKAGGWGWWGREKVEREGGAAGKGERRGRGSGGDEGEG